jgi:7 transmembrane receptor (Secretin family)
MTLFNYALTANYAWIFVEGLYLHTLLFVAVFSETSSVRLYIALGWSKCQSSMKLTLCAVGRCHYLFILR